MQIDIKVPIKPIKARKTRTFLGEIGDKTPAKINPTHNKTVN